MTTPQEAFRNAMAECAAAIYLITTDGPAGRYGITMTAVTSVTDNPPTLLICVNDKAAIRPILQANGCLCVNILSSAQQAAAEHFGGLTPLTPEERFEQHIWQRGQSGQLQIEGALAHLHGRITDSHQLGTHHVFYIAVEEMITRNTPLPALAYFRRRFIRVAEDQTVQAA